MNYVLLTSHHLLRSPHHLHSTLSQNKFLLPRLFSCLQLQQLKKKQQSLLKRQLSQRKPQLRMKLLLLKVKKHQLLNLKKQPRQRRKKLLLLKAKKRPKRRPLLRKRRPRNNLIPFRIKYCLAESAHRVFRQAFLLYKSTSSPPLVRRLFDASLILLRYFFHSAIFNIQYK